ncbi:hypothetical protein BJ944DRAFT_273149 [Cunninghamella echinulata]|nr:hypothetical protein BJ944DRAFT_273149 [Cunninghamella echinulata]
MALAVFSLKRNRSSSSKLYDNSHEPVNKLSRLFNKFTSSLLNHKQQQQQTTPPIRKVSIKKLNVIFKNETETNNNKIPQLHFIEQDKQQRKQQRLSQQSDIVFSKKEKLEYDPRYLSTVHTSKNGLPSILIRRPSSLSDMKSVTTTTLVQPHHEEKEENDDVDDEEKEKKRNTLTLSLNEQDIDHQLQQHYLTIHSSSNMTTCSGDLSAKEFADIAGIKIISDNDEDNEEEDNDHYFDNDDDNNNNNNNEWLFNHSHISSKHHSILDDHDKLSMITSSSSIYSHRHSKRHLPHIWDSEFWKDPTTTATTATSCKLKQQHLPLSEQKQNHEEEDNEHKEDIPNVLYELRKMNTTSNDCLKKSENNSLRKQQSCCVIKKGRFEVSLETAETS